MLTKDELESYLDSGYSLKSEWAVKIRNLMKKLNIKEIWDYDKKYGSDKE